MIRVENIDVYGFETAIRGMRNPMNSWDRSDSYYELANFCNHSYVVGDDDLALMRKLYKAGVEHRTYARMIYVWMDITAPLYWWKEMDRYGIGKSQLSTSTMHRIHAKEFTLNDFSVEHMDGDDIMLDVINKLNHYRKMFLETKDKEWWHRMIQLLPSSYNQKRTICMSYEVVFKIIKERTGHRLDEWNTFVEILETLPYIREIMGETE